MSVGVAVCGVGQRLGRGDHALRVRGIRVLSFGCCGCYSEAAGLES